jgi:hypothetical protein
MRSLLALPAIVLSIVGVGACGGAGKSAGSPSQAAAGAAATSAPDAARGYFKGDGDDDEVAGSGDGDDYLTRAYGHSAIAADGRAVTALVERYYAAAVAGDGATACSLVDSSIVRSPENLIKALPAEYAPASGSAVFRGKSCAQVAAVLFELDRQRLVALVPTLQVTSVRVEGVHGLALLGFKAAPERRIAVEREGGTWKIGALLDSLIP